MYIYIIPTSRDAAGREDESKASKEFGVERGLWEEAMVMLQPLLHPVVFLPFFF